MVKRSAQSLLRAACRAGAGRIRRADVVSASWDHRPMPEFGAQLRRRREAAGLSLAQFASLTNTSKGHLSKIETGRARVSLSVAEACDRALEAGGELLALVPGDRDRKPETGLPDTITHFLGRAAEVERLTAALQAPDGPPAFVVAGLGGIGKTALAIAAARRAADSYPGGQFLVELGQAGPDAATESGCVDRTLRALGVPSQRIPPDLAGRAALLRDQVRHQPVLLLVDDASSAAQLRSLLSVGRNCRLLVTSRRRLAALDDAQHLLVGPLPDEPARALFRSISGAGEEEPVDELVTLCGSVPLAIRIVAARLRHGGWTSAEMLDRLRDESSRVASMDDGERSMAAVLATSIDGLAESERRLLVLMGIHPGPVADLPTTAALADLPPVDTEVLLARLHESCLLTRQPGGLVILHDLVRAHLVAAEVPRLPPLSRSGALGRLVDHLLAWVAAADAAIEPDRYRPALGLPPVEEVATAPEALAWLRTQWPVVVAVMDRTRSAGILESCWQLGFLLRGFFFREKLTEPWLRSGRIALSAAEEAGATAWVGMLRNSLGMAHLERGELAAAARWHAAAEDAFAAAGDPVGAIDARASLAWVRHYQGAHDEALRDFGAALQSYRRLERPRSEGITLRGMALAAVARGRDEDASGYVLAASSFARTPLDRAMTHNCMAWVHFRAGRYDAARAEYAAAVDVARPESPYELARGLTGLGNVAAAAGDPAGAARHWRAADEQPVSLLAATVGETGARRALASTRPGAAGVAR
jgi:transcriptional regulator with XRE-family HTH domain/tetratricopeptide (TPR) repeat protein